MIILIHPLLPHWNNNFDTPSTIEFYKPLILNLLYIIPYRDAATPRLYNINVEILIHPLLPHWNDNFDTLSTTGLTNYFILNTLHAISIKARCATSLSGTNSILMHSLQSIIKQRGCACLQRRTLAWWFMRWVVISPLLYALRHHTSLCRCRQAIVPWMSLHRNYKPQCRLWHKWSWCCRSGWLPIPSRCRW